MDKKDFKIKKKTKIESPDANQDMLKQDKNGKKSNKVRKRLSLENKLNINKVST